MMNDLAIYEKQIAKFEHNHPVARVFYSTGSVAEKIRIGTTWEALAMNTRRSYEKAWGWCKRWLEKRGECFEDLNDEKVSLYLIAMDKDGKTPATIALTVSAIKWRFKHLEQLDLEWQTTDKRLKSIRRDSINRGPGQVSPMTYQLADRVCQATEADKSIAGLRDSAMIRLGSDCLLRVSEMVSINVEDLRDGTLTVKRSKTDQSQQGAVLFVGDETMQVIEEYKAAAGIQRGALFCRVLRDGVTVTTRLTADSARRIIKKRSQGIRGTEGKRISGHSLRVGSAVSLAQGGASLVDMQVDGRWRDSRMPVHYASAELAKNSATARIKYGKGG